MMKLLKRKTGADQPAAGKPKGSLFSNITPQHRRSARSFFHLVKSFRRKMAKDKIDVYSAQAAFYLIMSVFPMMMLAVMFLKFTTINEQTVLEVMAEIMNEDAMQTVTEIVHSVYSRSVTIISIASISLFWVAGRGIMGLSNGLNSIYGLKENRNYIVLRLRASGYTIMLVFALIVSLWLLALGMRFRVFLSGILPLSNSDSRFMRVALTAAALVMLTMVFEMLYVFLPNRKKRFKTQLYGSVFTTISWVIFSWAFMTYLSLAKNLSIIYGGLLTIVVIMLWLYYCLYLFFFGAEFNAWMENPDSFPF